MKNIYITTLILIFSSYNLLAQYNMSTTYVGHNDVNAARYEPSELELGEKHVQIGFNSYLWSGNTDIDFGLIKKMLVEGADVDTEIENILAQLSDKNLLGAGLDIQLASIAFQIKTKSDKRFDFSFSVVDKAALQVQFTKQLLDFNWNGNKQFAGLGPVDFGDNSLNVSYNREFAFGTAFPLFGSNGREDGVGMRLGIRAKYIQGILAINMEKSGMQLTTPADGRTLTIDWDYKVNTAGTDTDDFSPLNKTGKGFGIDLGLALYLGKKWEINASLLDVGKVKYEDTDKIRTFTKNSVITYEGAFISNLLGGGDVSNDTEYIYQPDETADPFELELASRFLIQAEFKTPKIGKDGREFNSNAIFLTYVQGFRDGPGTTTRPFFSIAYNKDIHKLFDVGVMAAYGGYNKLLLGGFFDINIDNFFKIGIGSDNLTPLFVADSGTGVDFSVNLSVAF